MPKLHDPAEVLRVVKARDFGGDLLLKEVQERVVAVLRMAEALSPKYHVVVANPPYASFKGLNDNLNKFAKDNYPRSKVDLFAMFLERSITMTREKGYFSHLNLPSWMFLPSFQEVRSILVDDCHLTSLVHLGRGMFGSDFGTVAFCVRKGAGHVDFPATFRRLFEKQVDVRSPKKIEQLFLDDTYGLHFARHDDFRKIPGKPIAYWLSPSIRALYENPLLGELFSIKEGVGTRNDEVFMKMAWEVSQDTIGQDRRWIRTDKAGDFRKWYLGPDFLMDWENDGERIKNYRNLDGSLRSRPQNLAFLFQPGVSWGLVGSGFTSFRWRPDGFGFTSASPTVFGEGAFGTLAQLNSNLMRFLLQVRGGTMNVTSGVVGELPNLSINQSVLDTTTEAAHRLFQASKTDWDSWELAADFRTLPLLQPDVRAETLEDSYATLRAHWQSMTDEMLT